MWQKTLDVPSQLYLKFGAIFLKNWVVNKGNIYALILLLVKIMELAHLDVHFFFYLAVK